MNKLPNIPPKIFSLSAVAVGYLLIDDLTANEQNALGNWLMLTAQVLCTNAYYKQVQTDYNNGNTTTDNNSGNSQFNEDETQVMLMKMVRALQKEVEELKKEVNRGD